MGHHGESCPEAHLGLVDGRTHGLLMQPIKTYLKLHQCHGNHVLFRFCQKFGGNIKCVVCRDGCPNRGEIHSLGLDNRDYSCR